MVNTLESAERRHGELAQLMEQIGAEDSANLPTRVVVSTAKGDAHLGQEDDPPYIDFVFTVVNASILPVEVSDQTNGTILMDKRTLIMSYEIIYARGLLLHGEKRELTVRQYLSNQDANEAVHWHKSDMLPFHFMKFNIWLTAKPWHGFENPKARLALPATVWLPSKGLTRV